MKYLTTIAVPFLAGQALASLNCTVVSPTLTKRYCEWDGCQAYETAVASDIVHAGCRADCDTNEECVHLSSWNNTTRALTLTT